MLSLATSAKRSKGMLPRDKLGGKEIAGTQHAECCGNNTQLKLHGFKQIATQGTEPGSSLHNSTP